MPKRCITYDLLHSRLNASRFPQKRKWTAAEKLLAILGIGIRTVRREDQRRRRGRAHHHTAALPHDFGYRIELAVFVYLAQRVVDIVAPTPVHDKSIAITALGKLQARLEIAV